jgi:glycosyltransferase involved in cell wall biosynthesis
MNPPSRMNILLYGRSSTHRGVGPDTYANQLITALSGLCTLGEFVGKNQQWQEWDVLHVLDMKHVSYKLLKECPIPIVIDVHDIYWLEGLSYYCPLRWLRRLLAWRRRKKYPKLLYKASKIIVHSQFVHNVLCNYLPNEHRHKVALVPYSVAVSESHTEKLPLHPPKILFVGRDLFRKGFPTLIDALEILLKRKVDVQLGVVGQEYYHSFRWAVRRCRKLPVTFLGGLSPQDLHREILNSDIVVLPSYTEAFGMALLEAQALGIPVVGSKVGGIPETMEDGQTGILVLPNNPVALADALESLLKDDKCRQQMGEQGKFWVQKHYPPSQMADALIEVYQSIFPPT